MRFISLIIICLMIAIGCNINKKKDVGNENSSQLVEDSLSVDADSIVFAGQKILEGESIWGSNEKYIFSLMDSLSSTKPESRRIYFEIFGKICEQADGYVAEVIGLYVLKYFEKYPKEFFENAKYISDSTFNSMAYLAGWELSMSEDNSEDFVQALKKKTIESINNPSDYEKKKMDEFFNQLKSAFSTNEY